MSDEDNFIRLADRMALLPPYLFGRINRRRDELRKAGVDVIDMAMGNPTDATPEPIVEKLIEVVRDPRNHRYSVGGGIYNLRREVAKYYQREWDVDLDPASEVIATIGSKEGFSHLCLALIGPGDTALIPTPSFPIHSHGVALAGGHYIGINVLDDEHFLSELDQLCRTLKPAPKVLFLNYPHNPSAHTVEQAFFDAVVPLAKKHELIVVHDFAYGKVCFDGYRAPSFLRSPGAKDVGVEFTTMSKTFNMAGWRIGFCAGNPKIISALGAIKGYYDYGIFQAIQIAAIIGMRHCGEFADQQAQKYQRRRDVVLEGLQRIGWPDVPKPRAGMFVWAPIPAEFATAGSMAFADQLLEDAAVTVSPGAGFGPEGEFAVRMALVENRQRLQQAVRQIGRAFRKWRDPVTQKEMS
ncbi:MAG: aminotransferase class I/II-fold pyridoxal phosphate-dependent enzyme [Gammaproteobacteria bacterium]|nr:aminotransferase class I/II-fold pyridoxal phosphate-dependent enzyme [Gammaproteobacteria bacterium]NNF60005.1 aminotransferase class I/II-fold pyridoxal phosphate-dependent enzyme [Gammaproteobacteria bacterium]NNM20091.1 aminotransferase class I/II-fold pyridoxal phosphate-dependent enzyme [Gammaproteobacteria bacterium]